MKRKALWVITVLLLSFLAACGNRTITIQFDAKGGSSVETMEVKQLITIEEPTTIREGYTFGGWFYEDTYETIFDFDKGASRNIKLYAKWTINQYTISFETDNDEDIQPITGDYQSTLSIPNNLEKEGYTFGGWYRDEDLTESFNQTRMPAQDMTLYAKWNPIIFVVEFYIDDELHATRSVQHGEALENIPALPQRVGYNGVWSITDFSSITENLTIEAIYTKKTYTVTFEDEWGHVYHTETVEHGDKASGPSESPSKTGYTFVGYSEDLNDLIIISDQTIHVVYTPLTFIVTFRVSGNQVKSETVAYGASATAPTVNVGGYTFNGWDKSFDNITANIEVNAILTPNTYVITVHANGGMFEDDLLEDDISSPYQSMVNYTKVPTRLGYQFAGWYTDENGTGSQVQLTNYSMPLGGMNLYAKWEVINYSIQYQNLFGTQSGNPLTYNVTKAIVLQSPTSRIGYDFNGWYDAISGGVLVTEISLGSTGNKILYAQWTPKVYSISYENLQGTSHSNPATYTIEDETIELTDPSARTGYTFAGWYTQLSGGVEVTEIAQGSTGNKTLYARWTAITYTITYGNLQGTNHINPASYTIQTPTFALGNPTARTGYTFAGWYDAPEEGTLYEEIPVGSIGNLSLYAKWTALTYTITFDVQGGTPISNQMVTYDQAYTLPTAVKTGYTFTGWTLDGEAFTEGTWNLLENITLVATYEANSYTITFDVSGGTPISDQTVTYDQAYTLPTAEKTGYTFDGWTLSGSPFGAGTWNLLEDITLVATYEANVYTLTYENLQGTSHSNPATYTIEDETIELTDPSARTGYTFAGWYTQLSGGVEVTEIAQGSTGNKTLYARWNANTYTISFNVGDGNPVSDLLVTFNQSFILPTTTRTGYSFAGWTLNGDSFVSGTWILTESIELVALWTEWPVITFESNGGSSIQAISQTPGSSIVEPLDPTRSGYTFDAWYSESTFDTLYVFDTMPNEDMTLYAKWTALTYTITFDVQGGTPISNQMVTYDQAYTLPTAEKTGYTFTGWTLDGEAFTEGTWNLLENITLVATYEANSYTITFDVSGGTPISDQTVTYDQAYTLLTAEKTGYTFDGWTLSGSPFGAGTWNLLEDITLVATYEANVYTLTYENLQGTSHSNPATYTIEDEMIELTDPSARTGYTFAGWYTQLSGGVEVTEIAQGSTGNKTLYARWTAITYTITYGNLQGTNHINPASYTIQTPTFALGNPTARTGYTFAGWYDAPEEGTLYEEIPVGSIGNLSLYAKWTALTYTITFDVQGGTPISNQMVTYDQAYTLPTAVKTGYTFTGWTLDGEAFAEGTWNLLENITLVATYEANSYTITFDVSGGTPISDQTVTYDQAYTLPTAEKTGYTFDGWTLSGSPFGAGTWNLLEDITLVATYEANVYTLTYENLQGTSHSNPATYTIEDETIELTDPSARTGYTFAGWYTQLSGGVEVTEIAQGSTGNKTLYARWTAITYTITYGNLQGTNHINPTTYTVETEDINLLDPSALEHYTFSGWFTEETGGTEITVIETQTADHLTIYAQWIPVDYTISFDIDGTITTIDRPYGSNLVESDIPTIPAKANYDVTAPSWDHNPLGYQVVGDYTFVAVYVGNPMTVTYVTNEGSLVPDDIVAYGSLLVMPEVPTRNGYLFVAWYQDSDLANIYDFNVEVTASMTLYAQWEREFYTWEIESIFQREDLENSSIAIDPDQPSVLYEYINLFYGQELSPIQTYEGYLFDHFTYDGIDYSSIDQLIMVTGNRLDTSRILVYYHRIIITITFSQDPDLFTDPEEPLVSFRIYYNQSFDIPESLVDPRDPAGGLAVWDRTQFDYLKQDLTVYALYYATGVKSVTFIDRGIIRYVASEIGEETTVIGLSSILWNLNRPGYKFMGWFTEEEGGTLLPKAIYEFDYFSLNQNYLYARWMLLEPFSQPENVLVTVDETSIVMSWTLDPATINGNEPSGFEYLINNVLIEDLVTVPVLSGTTYTLTLLDSNPEFVLFEDLLNPGLHEISIRALGDNDNHYDGEFSDVYTFKNASIFDEDPTEVATYDYFIIETFGETKRYVFYTNLEYQFGASYTFEMVSGDEYASASANKIITKGLSGSFKFRMIREGHPTVVYDALVVHDIKQFNIGPNYQNYLNAKQEEQNVFLDQATNYYVGYQNEFYIDVRMINNQGSRISLANVYLEYDLYEYVLGSYQLIDDQFLDDYIEFLADNKLRMKEDTVGKQFKLTAKPKYQATQMTVNTLEYTFIVNDGHNAYSNHELKTLFGDFNVETINIHANIQAELAANQKNADGSPINKRPTVSNPVTGNVYSRFSESIDNDSITIEGNYMTIDGSNLPYSNKNSGSGLVGFAQSFEVINVQIAIFSYSVRDANLVPAVNEPPTNNNQLNVNNLILKGNTSTPYVDFDGTVEQIELQERLMSKNSGGYIGFFVEHGRTDFNNMVIMNTVIAVTHNSYGLNTLNEPTYAYYDHVKVYNSWANSLYTHGGNGMIVTNSYIGQSGGSSIHMVDYRKFGTTSTPTSYPHNNPYLYLDSTTTIENWISGEEAWFKAYGMSQVALTLKSGIETGIQGTGRSIIQTVTNPVNGLEIEMLNFILLTESSSGAENYSNPPTNTILDSGSEVKLNINGVQVERPFNYLSSPTDPRVDTVNQRFVFPLGAVSNVADFVTYYTNIREQVATDADANNVASLGAFYGLAWNEALQVAGYMSAVPGSTPMQAINYNGYTPTFPEYLEILSVVPVFPNGFSSIIIQLNPLS